MTKARPQPDMAGYTIYHGDKRPAKVAHDDRVSVQMCDGSFGSGFAYRIDWPEVAAYAVIPRKESSQSASVYQATRDRPETIDELIPDFVHTKTNIYRLIREHTNLIHELTQRIETLEAQAKYREAV
jgi:hypothetical protein